MSKKNPVYINGKQLCEKIGIDRSTLTRLHQRHAVPESKMWARKPQPHRLYDEDEVKAIQKYFDDKLAKRVPPNAVFIGEKK